MKTKNLVVRRTTRPHILAVLTYFLVAEDTRTLEFCYPDSECCIPASLRHLKKTNNKQMRDPGVL